MPPHRGWRVTNRVLYEGCALQAVDAKGRVALPADLRGPMERNADDRLIVISLSPHAPCLLARDTGQSARMFARADQIEAEAASGVDHLAKSRLFGRVVRQTFDPSGRFILPGFYKAKAGITDWAFFSAAGDTIEIWSPARILASDDEELRELCQYFMDEKGVTL